MQSSSYLHHLYSVCHKPIPQSELEKARQPAFRHLPQRQPALRLRLKLASSTHWVTHFFCIRFSPGQISSTRGHDSLGGRDSEGGRTSLGEGNAVGRRVGFFVGRRVGVWTPLTIENDTRYVVSILPFTLAVTVCAPAWRLTH
jgi:hypothetical protein